MQHNSSSHAQRPPARADVVVAGGGPSGSTVATLLAKLGYSVVLLEARHFPRPHIGESLTPSVHRIFEFLEIRALVDAAGFVRMPGHTVHWGGKEDTFRFSDEFDRPTMGYQLWREQFDSLLVDRARSVGVHVHHGFRVTAPILGSDGAVVGARYVTRDAPAGTIEAQLVIDATGQSGLLTRARGLRAIDAPARSLSLWAYWRAAGDLSGDDQFNTFVESIPDGWIWSVRSRADLRNVTINVDLDDARAELRRLGLAQFYRSRIAQGATTSGMLATADQATRVRGCDTTWYHATRYGDEGMLSVGDAACLIDPLTSQGVRKALSSAINGAIVANTILCDRAMTGVAHAFHQEREENAYQRYRRESVRAFLDEPRFTDRPYWQKRSQSTFGDPIPEPPQPRRGLLRTMARDIRLQDMVLRWSEGTHLDDGAVVEGPVLKRRRLFKNAQRPEGRIYPDVDPEHLFSIIDGQTVLTEVVDRYIQRTGRSRDDRAQVMTVIERLVEDWLCDVETRA